MRLILFDIDGTLVLTGGAGGRAMARAFREVFGTEHGLKSLSMAGRTDAWIVAQMASHHGLACGEETIARFHDTYVDHLAREIHEPGPQKGILPGVRPLLEALTADSRAQVALLTGNYEKGARIKLEYFRLWKYFACGAFGDSTYDRNSLLWTAIERVQASCGISVPPSDVTIVGDTPLDVAVALAGGARSVAVATGSYDVDSLKACGADVVLENLEDVGAAMEAMGC
jgi:phosphoglycolate phosphatase-like HAD superfamily hydrolase